MAIEKAVPKEIPNENRRRSYVPIPITDAMRPIALALIAKGGIEYEEMSDILKTKYKVVLAPEELRRLAKTDAGTIADLRKKIRKSAEAESSKMLKKVDRILDRKLTRTLNDMDKLDDLDILFAQGLMDQNEYNQATAKLKIEPLQDVLKIAEYLNPRPPQGRGAAVALPPSSNSQSTTPELSDGSMHEVSSALAEAIKNGDTVEMQRILYKGSATNDNNKS